jgi:hypothetical protein
MADQRIVELEALALHEGFRLPMAADLIAYFERQGYVVDLCTGEVYRDVQVAVAPSAQALCHLYGVSDDDVTAIFAPVDYAAELEDLIEGREDEEYWRRGGW